MSASNVSSSVTSSSNKLKRKHSSNHDETVKQAVLPSASHNKSHEDKTNSPKPRNGWYSERYLMLVFNSFEPTDIHKVLEKYKRPEGIPKGWCFSYCAHKDCNTRVEDDMTGSGWCKQHTNTKVLPLPLHKVEHMLIDGLFGKTDIRHKVEKILEDSNGVFLARREIDEILAVVLETPKTENEERPSKRQRLAQDNNQCSKTSLRKNVDNTKKVEESKHYIPFDKSSVRKPLSETNVQVKAPGDQIQTATEGDSVKSINDKKRKAMNDTDDNSAKRPRLDSNSSAAVLRPSSIDTYFETTKEQAKLRQAQNPDTFFGSHRNQACLPNTRVPRNRQRIPEKKKKTPASQAGARDQTR